MGREQQLIRNAYILRIANNQFSSIKNGSSIVSGGRTPQRKLKYRTNFDK